MYCIPLPPTKNKNNKHLICSHCRGVSQAHDRPSPYKYRYIQVGYSSTITTTITTIITIQYYYIMSSGRTYHLCSFVAKYDAAFCKSHRNRALDPPPQPVRRTRRGVFLDLHAAVALSYGRFTGISGTRAVACTPFSDTADIARAHSEYRLLAVSPRYIRLGTDKTR